MKWKKLRISKKLLYIFLQGDQFAHQEINEKNTFLALTYSKKKIFSKFQKQMII
jgi:hypothetical protein